MRGFLPGIRSENMLHLRYDTGASAGVRLRNVICYVTVRDTVKQSVESAGSNKGRAYASRLSGFVREIRIMKLTQLDNVFSVRCFRGTLKRSSFAKGKIIFSFLLNLILSCSSRFVLRVLYFSRVAFHIFSKFFFPPLIAGISPRNKYSRGEMIYFLTYNLSRSIRNKNSELLNIFQAKRNIGISISNV